MADELAALRELVESYRDRMVRDLQALVRIPSVAADPLPGAPYGAEVRKALDAALALSRDLGFRTHDAGGHAGHAEFGAGREMVAAIGHLDVVPAGGRWRHDPYSGQLEGGAVYGRGSADDKGPTIAALFAAKALMDSGLPISRRVRVIFGCDEESGRFGCMRHYWEVEGHEKPTAAFTPDARFPLIFAEKGICDLRLERPVDPQDAPLRVSTLQGGQRPNMVPDLATARLEGTRAALYLAACALQAHWDANVTALIQPDAIVVRAVGKSAHASTPQSGDNAIARLARALLALELPFDADWLRWVVRVSDPSGAGLGLQAVDEVTGHLTANLGVAEMASGGIRATVNVRYPVSWTLATVLARAEQAIAADHVSLTATMDNPPLHVPLDAEPARTLLRVYREETGDFASEPATMGGGTYARAIPNAVAFGAVLPGSSEGPAHEPDERFSVETVMRAASIYARAFYELAR